MLLLCSSIIPAILHNIIHMPTILPLCSIPLSFYDSNSNTRADTKSSKQRTKMKKPLLLLLLLQFNIIHLHALFFCSLSLSIAADDSLDASVQQSVLTTLTRHHHLATGSPYRAAIPGGLAGMGVSILRLRTNTLWSKGSNFSHFTIPSRTVPIPHVKRLLIVYQNLGNLSSRYYDVPGFSLATSIVGFSVYDASNLSSTPATVKRIDLDTSGRDITVRFGEIKKSSGQRCVFFTSSGGVVFSDMTLPGTCFAQEQGRFCVVVPVEKRRSVGEVWAIGAVLCSAGLVILGCCLVVGLCRISKTKKVRVMEREAADDGELFQNFWVSGTKMPSATGTRTQPSVEDGGFT